MTHESCGDTATNRRLPQHRPRPGHIADRDSDKFRVAPTKSSRGKAVGSNRTACQNSCAAPALIMSPKGMDTYFAHRMLEARGDEGGDRYNP